MRAWRPPRPPDKDQPQGCSSGGPRPPLRLHRPPLTTAGCSPSAAHGLASGVPACQAPPPAPRPPRRLLCSSGSGNRAQGAAREVMSSPRGRQAPQGGRGGHIRQVPAQVPRRAPRTLPGKRQAPRVRQCTPAPHTAGRAAPGTCLPSSCRGAQLPAEDAQRQAWWGRGGAPEGCAPRTGGPRFSEAPLLLAAPRPLPRAGGKARPPRRPRPWPLRAGEGSRLPSAGLAPLRLPSGEGALAGPRGLARRLRPAVSRRPVPGGGPGRGALRFQPQPRGRRLFRGAGRAPAAQRRRPRRPRPHPPRPAPPGRPRPLTCHRRRLAQHQPPTLPLRGRGGDRGVSGRPRPPAPARRAPAPSCRPAA